MNFHSRVLLVFTGLLVLALLGASVAMFLAAKRTSLGLAVQQLEVTDRLVQENLRLRDRQLRESTGALAADFGFREAVASNDKGTIRSALENQGARINADVAILLDDGGSVRASTDANANSAVYPSLLEALNQVRAGNKSPAILRFRGGLLQVAIVPVRAPDIIAWAAMGFVIRDDVVALIKEIGGVDVSLLVADGGARFDVVASTLPPATRGVLAARAGEFPGAGTVGTLDLSGEDYLTTVTAGKSSVNDAYSVVLQMPMTSVAVPMDSLRREFLASGAVITIVCLVAAVVSARLLAQPVRALSDAARSLTMSKRRSGAADGRGDNELANLAEAFHALARRAHYDALTGLPNRALLKDRLDESLARMKRDKLTLAVVFIDLNGFKAINDKLGHEMGDLVLRKTAQRFSRTLAAPHTVARLGGDEFVLVLEGVSESAALKTVEGLMDVIATPMKSPQGSVKVGMSAGIAMYPALSADRETLLKEADAAMYRSKSRRLGPVVAKKGDVADPGASVAVDRRPAQRPAPPIDEELEASAWSGDWEGKDLSTQTTRILQAADAGALAAQAAPIPVRERERLAALHDLKLLDTAPSESFNRVTRLAAKTLGAPIALISLVDENRQWFLSKFGIDVSETSRDTSFCAYAIFDCKPLIVADATLDARFAHNSLVTDEPYIRAYAGIPLRTRGGHAVGTLCVVDTRARSFNEADMNALRDLSAIVESLIKSWQRRQAA